MAIKIEATNKALSSLGGLSFFNELFSRLSINEMIKKSLPVNKIKVKKTSLDKFKSLVFGFIAGADCLDDMAFYGEDPAFSAVTGGVNAANTYGGFLRSFSQFGLRELNLKLIELSLKLRKASHCHDNTFIIDIDSTSHIQHGEKMEGLSFNYKNEWGLDSLLAYDQYGYQYWSYVREGNTYTSNGAPEVIYQVFSRIPKKLSNKIAVKKILRTDSGYCNLDVFKAALNNGADFICCMRANMFGPLIGTVKNWYKAKKVRMVGNRECEIGHTLYYPKDGPGPLRVVMLRALKDQTNRPLFEEDAYDYQGWVTSLGEHEFQDEKLVILYRNRGHAENFIRENKNNFPLYHFPCQSLMANRAYALIAAFAYVLMRYAGFILNKKSPHFGKKVRRRMVFLAVQVVKKAREIIFLFHRNLNKEVNLWLETIKIELGCG